MLWVKNVWGQLTPPKPKVWPKTQRIQLTISKKCIFGIWVFLKCAFTTLKKTLNFFFGKIHFQKITHLINALSKNQLFKIHFEHVKHICAVKLFWIIGTDWYFGLTKSQLFYRSKRHRIPNIARIFVNHRKHVGKQTLQDKLCSNHIGPYWGRLFAIKQSPLKHG